MAIKNMTVLNWEAYLKLGFTEDGFELYLGHDFGNSQEAILWTNDSNILVLMLTSYQGASEIELTHLN